MGSWASLAASLLLLASTSPPAAWALCYTGTYVVGNTCDLCPAGTEGPTLNLASCHPCPPGWWSGVGASWCSPCNNGFYAPGFGSTWCQACPAGTFSEQIVASSNCFPCLPGTYSYGGAIACSPCPANTFSNTSGSTWCTSCPSGLQSSAGQTVCYP